MGFLQNFKFELEGAESAPVLVFLHGVMGSASNWRKITPAFKNKLRVLTFDQRGHGWSFKPEKGYTPSDFADDLYKILEELQIDKIHLLGHSMGGRNALQFAELYPDRLLSLIVEDIGPLGHEEDRGKIRQLLDLVPTPFDSKKAAQEFFTQVFPEKIKYHPQKNILGSYLFMNIQENQSGQADWRFYKNGILEAIEIGHGQSFWPTIERLKVPTLFIRGENSTDLTREELNLILKSNPVIQGVEIPQAGHWVHYDQPTEFIKVIYNFLNL